jgi:SAM-dependent methyltransferase
MDESVEAFQLSLDAAEAYETTFVPALFGEWAPHLVEAAGVSAGQAVLDVACGTGIVARTAAGRLASSGAVVGVDLNDAMLAVARRLRPDLDWRSGDASALPFPEASFDVVMCQAALMFFPDKAQALREMARVVQPRGTVALQVWASLEDQPAYRVLVEAAVRHAGPEAVDLLSAYWVLGDIDVMDGLLDAAGLEVTRTARRVGTVSFPSLDELVRVEVEATPLIDRIDDASYRRIRRDACAALAGFETSDGRAELPIVGHIVTARRSGC